MPGAGRLRLLLPVLLTLAGSGCGLPQEPYLYAPISRTTAGNPGVFEFENPTDNDPDIFLGFLLFYKLYLSSDAALGGDLQATGESFFTSYRLNTYNIPDERGVSSGYTLFKVLSFDDITAPGSWEGDASLGELNFGDINNTAGSYTAANGTTELLTFAPLERKFYSGSDTSSWEEPPVAFSASSTDYELDHSDLPAGVTDLSAPDLSFTIAVWAVSYGFDIYDSFQNVYSEAEYIGQFEYTLF